MAERALKERFIGVDGQCERLAGVQATYVTGLANPDSAIAPRCLVTGPVSSGKTSICEFIATQLHVPAVVINGGSLAPESYKGSSLCDHLRDAIELAGGVQRIEKNGCVVVIDEWDKLAQRGRSDAFVNSVQFNLYGLLGGEQILIESESDYEKTFARFRTNRFLIFLCGAFSAVPERCWRDAESSIKTLLRLGYQPELVSRINHFVHMKKPDHKSYLQMVEREYKLIAQNYANGSDHPLVDRSTLAKLARKLSGSDMGLRSIRVDLHHELFNAARAEGVSTLV
jgi:ATP-dependent protease Clp ATPase subunit